MGYLRPSLDLGVRSNKHVPTTIQQV